MPGIFHLQSTFKHHKHLLSQYNVVLLGHKVEQEWLAYGPYPTL